VAARNDSSPSIDRAFPHRDVEIVVANVSRGLQVNLRFNRHRIRERDIAALQPELNAVEGCVPFQDVGAAKYAGRATDREDADRRRRKAGPPQSSSAVPAPLLTATSSFTLYSGEFAGVINADWRLRSRYEPKSKPGVTASFVTRISPEIVEAERFPTQCNSAVAVELTPGG